MNTFFCLCGVAGSSLTLCIYIFVGYIYVVAQLFRSGPFSSWVGLAGHDEKGTLFLVSGKSPVRI